MNPISVNSSRLSPLKSKLSALSPLSCSSYSLLNQTKSTLGTPKTSKASFEPHHVLTSNRSVNKVMVQLIDRKSMKDNSQQLGNKWSELNVQQVQSESSEEAVDFTKLRGTFKNELEQIEISQEQISELDLYDFEQFFQ
ncbi:Hypothetical_protein [Hexamita inflata]|uniref:Hypothetical_protein n=1 Tax=Hexamita inflata TaxID=28002 RepID=A0AA86Q817_9EUKA|nr:Hypothetical protein HINF_LOCUS41556 [Hexamita inflata]